MDKLDDPLVGVNLNLRRSHIDFLRARAKENDGSISAELRRLLRDAAERAAAQTEPKVAA